MIRAGAASVEITPETDVQLAGAVGVRRPARFIQDPLFAKALVVESGSRKICLVSLDLCVVTSGPVDEIRHSAANELGFDPNAIMIHATQTHSAPSLGNFMLSDDFQGLSPEFEWLRGGDARYDAFAKPRILEAIRQAEAGLECAHVGAASAIEGRMAHNRRAVGRDGLVIMPGPSWALQDKSVGRGPLGPTKIRYMEGPMDPELGVVCFRRESLHLSALLVNYTCHPVHNFPKPCVSADWPGALSSELRSRYGAGCIPLVTNGACGNINPWPPFDPNYVEDQAVMGRILAERVTAAVNTVEFKAEAEVDWRVRTVKIPLREIDDRELEKARDILGQNPQPVWNPQRTAVDVRWAMAAGLLDLYRLKQRSPEHEYEIQVFRIGDTAIVGLPGEPFVEGGLAIKLASPTYPTYVVHGVNSYVGYLPTKEAFARGGHETATGNWSRLIPEALDIVVANAKEMLLDLF